MEIQSKQQFICVSALVEGSNPSDCLVSMYFTLIQAGFACNEFTQDFWVNKSDLSSNSMSENEFERKRRRGLANPSVCLERLPQTGEIVTSSSASPLGLFAGDETAIKSFFALSFDPHRDSVFYPDREFIRSIARQSQQHGTGQSVHRSHPISNPDA
jgi:hypothetical protein